MTYQDRKQAGIQLSAFLQDYQKDKNLLVLGLPRGGVQVAEGVAQALRAPLDVVLLRKLPYPPQPELAIGAVAEDGSIFINQEFQNAVEQQPDSLEPIVREQMGIIRNRAKLYRPHRHAHEVKGKTVILVDDGIATGATMKVAVRSARASGAAKVVVAIPVAAPSSEADEVVCLDAPEEFLAVGQAYENFDQVTDDEVCTILDRNP
ncbi:MAG: phosphoribosyltransferase [Verrucomicrobia bacterium]|nr:phosphoribosyltransferase [Verrucomicrobiota bacterium]